MAARSWRSTVCPSRRPLAEDEGIYRHFAELLDRRESHVDPAPFRLVADAFLVGRRVVTEPFVE